MLLFVGLLLWPLLLASWVGLQFVWPGWWDEVLWFTSNARHRAWFWIQLQYYRRKAGRCLTCGYDLIHNTSGTCPECGTPICRDWKPLV